MARFEEWVRCPMPQRSRNRDDLDMMSGGLQGGIAAARRVLALAAVAAAVAGLAPAVPAGAVPPPAFTTLAPGQRARLHETLPVQVVLVGYEPDVVPEETLREYLPGTARPIDRSRAARAILQQLGDDATWATPGVAEIVVAHELGLTYTFDHTVVYADDVYEDAFFGYLTSIGREESDVTGYDISLYQFLYNQQPGRALDITDNLVVDAVSVERWLLEHPAPGIDPDRDTVVLVNWWGRDDFRFHEYQVPGDPQSETGVQMGETYWSTRLIGWGGTGPHDEESGFGRESRTWFHDLSAGPDWRSGGWVIDDPLGFGPDPSWQTIFPPAWEYLTGHALDRWPLPDALGAITRFVAVNLLFAASPLYGTDADARMDQDIELDVTVYGDHGRPLLTPALLAQEIGDLLGTTPRVDVSRQGLTGTPAQCFEAFVGAQRCRPETDPAVYPSDADFFVAAEREIRQWRDGSAAYEAPGFVYAATGRPKWLGFADENWTDGTRTAVYSLPTQESLAAGLGATSALIHEYGHHFGVGHSHDGYETEWGPYAYRAGDDEFGVFFFAWVGDEVSSVMTYLDLNNDFSQFDLDNFRRWQAARYLRAGNLIAADVLASRQAAAGRPALASADASFTAAQRALDAHDYATAEARAAAGYRSVREAATAARVAVDTMDRWAMTPHGRWHGHPSVAAHSPSTDPVDARAGAAEPPADLLARFEATTD
jgi:hypothetical protein